MNSTLAKSIEYVKGVGPARAEKLSKLGIDNLADLLFYFPRDYEDRSRVIPIKDAIPGDTVTVKGEVYSIEKSRLRENLELLKVTFIDHSDAVIGSWFNQGYLAKNFSRGEEFYLHGQISEKSWRQYKKKEINNPVYENVDSEDLIHTNRIVPIYTLTKNLNQKQLRSIIYRAVNNYANKLNDWLPAYLKRKYKLPHIGDAVREYHFPSGRDSFIKARQRLAFSELFLFQLRLMMEKNQYQIKKGYSHPVSTELMADFLEELDFKLTSAQKKAWHDIAADLEKNVPMQRLLQGDVGSGKTVVAALALLAVISNKRLSLYMAPTEILAEQQYFTLQELFKNLPVNIGLITGSSSSGDKEEILERIETENLNIVVGTHALFQDDINYKNLGLVVIDEQHRFGVRQRQRLMEKGENPDLLVMTATPIPRSLAMTLYGDLDVSVIGEMPPGRSPVITYWRKRNKRRQIYDFVNQRIEAGDQAFVVTSLIEPSEEMPNLISVDELYQQLNERFLPDKNIGMVHGQMSAAEKQEIMKEFKQGKIDLIVATTVIEVGIDVPNATVMVIEDADRFGLAQLHQLRGRVGRGDKQSFCILIADPKTEEGIQRIEAMVASSDGFDIAEKDLEIRGPGEFFGTRQHGIDEFRVANLIQDQKILEIARDEAVKLTSKKGWENKYPDIVNKISQLKVII